MKRSESIKEIATALAKAQGEMESAKKDMKNPFFGSKYSDLASVIEAIKKPFSDNGLSYSQFPLSNEKQEVGMETIIMHSSGEWMMGEPLFLPVNKNDAQGYGSAMTYAKRYSLQAAVGLSSEDDDGNEATKGKPKDNTKPTDKPFTKAHAARGGAFDGLSEDIQKQLRNIHANIMPLYNSRKLVEALNVLDIAFIDSLEVVDGIEQPQQRPLDADERVALWDLFDAPIRTALVNERNKLKQQIKEIK